MKTIKSIVEYRNHILGLDSSIVCEFYENDLLFIIAIDDNKYKSCKQQLNEIGYDIHEKYDLEKDIVCMPKSFVSKWDKPMMLQTIQYESFEKQLNEIGYDIHEKYDLEKDIVCMPKSFVSQLDNGTKQYKNNKKQGISYGCEVA